MYSRYYTTRNALYETKLLASFLQKGVYLTKYINFRAHNPNSDSSKYDKVGEAGVFAVTLSLSF